ncbi:MAG: FAD-dependent oxidoreductase [Pseudonocardiales bacterium]|nr:FAD-dependent oxidoreductase [Pseudonocardiales bacterium]
MITATDARDAEQARQGLVAKGVQVVLVAVVEPDQPDAPDTPMPSEWTEEGSLAGRLRLVPDVESEVESRQDDTVPVPFTSAFLSDLNVQQQIGQQQIGTIQNVDNAIYKWWNGARQEERGSLVVSAEITAHFRSKRAFEIRIFLAGSGVNCTWNEAPEGDHIIVTVTNDNTIILVDPSLANLAAACGLVDPPTTDWYDVVVVGGGPAGLAAALYAGYEYLKTLIIEADVPGGQISTNPYMANYLGLPDGITGYQFAQNALTQIRRSKNVQWESARKATKIILGSNAQSPHQVEVAEVDETSLAAGAGAPTIYKAGAVIIASGATWNILKDVTGIERVTGRGVYYLLLPGDIPHTKGAEVVIVGGGDTATGAAWTLLNSKDGPQHITMVVRGDKIESYIDEIIEYIEQKEKEGRITILKKSTVKECKADNKKELSSVVVSTRVASTDGSPETTIETTISATWMYCLIGYSPNSAWIDKKIDRVTTGAIVTGCGTSSTQTNVLGIYAIGDVAYESLARVGAAAGKGAVAIAELVAYKSSNPAPFPKPKL